LSTSVRRIRLPCTRSIASEARFRSSYERPSYRTLVASAMSGSSITCSCRATQPVPGAKSRASKSQSRSTAGRASRTMIVKASLRFHSTQSPPTSWTTVPIASSCLSLSLSLASGTRPRLATRSRLAACSSADCESWRSAAGLLPWAASACAAPDTVATRLTSKPRSREVWSPRLGSRVFPASRSRCFVISTVPSRIAFSWDDVTSPSVAAESLNSLTAAFCLADRAHPVRSRSAAAREKARRRSAVLEEVMSYPAACREKISAPSTGAVASASVAVAAGLGVLVELAAQVQSLEDELERRRRAGRITCAELLHGGVQRAHLGDLADVLFGRHRVGDVDAEAALKGGHDRIELAAREAAVEDVEHRLLHELAEDLVLAAVAERLELDLAAGRGDDGPQGP